MVHMASASKFGDLPRRFQKIRCCQKIALIQPGVTIHRTDQQHRQNADPDEHNAAGRCDRQNHRHHGDGDDIRLTPASPLKSNDHHLVGIRIAWPLQRAEKWRRRQKEKSQREQDYRHPFGSSSLGRWNLACDQRGSSRGRRGTDYRWRLSARLRLRLLVGRGRLPVLLMQFGRTLGTGRRGRHRQGWLVIGNHRYLTPWNFA